MSAVLDYWDKRLENWALWEVSGNSVGVSSYDGMWWESPPRPPIPLVGEALDTDRLVHRLEHELYVAVRARYVWTGDEGDKARTLKIHRNTLLDRVNRAKWALDDLYQADRRRNTNHPVTLYA